jgi:hypothetical protein
LLAKPLRLQLSGQTRVTSFVPPGGKPTRIRTGRDG